MRLPGLGLEANVAYVFEEACVCVLLAGALGGLLLMVTSIVVITREILGMVVDRAASGAVTLKREERISMPARTDREYGENRTCLNV